MLLKALFWILVVCDLAGIGLFLLLGLAAAGSSRSSPLAVVALMLVLPGAVLLAAVILFLLAKSWLGRGIAFAIVALPLLFLVGSSALGSASMMLYQRDDGTLAHFLPGGMRDVEDAVLRDDAAALATAVRSVDPAKLGRGGTNILVVALRRLEKNPHSTDVLRVLLEAGADPNAGEIEKPLKEAIRVSPTAGIAPVRMLLDAGADPNQPDTFGDPVYFLASGIQIPLEVLELLIARGADLTHKSRDGSTVLRQAVNSQNWPAVLLLLQKGADWRETRMLNGMDFRTKLEQEAHTFGDGKGLAEVLRYLNDAERSTSR